MRLADIMDWPKIVIAGEINWGTLGYLDKQMQGFLEVKVQEKPWHGIALIVSTCGGDSYATQTICERLRIWQKMGFHFCFVGTGIVYSAGTVVMMQIPLKNRFLTQNTDVMLHNSFVGESRGISPYGNTQAREAALNEFQQRIDAQKRGDEWAARHIASGWHRDIEEVKRLLDKGIFFSAREAVDAGLVDSILKED